MCDKNMGYVCHMSALDPWSTESSTIPSATKLLETQAVKDTVNERSCIHPTNEEVHNNQVASNSTLPDVDVFLNPTKENLREKVVSQKEENAKKYFDNVDMKSLYPELFDILWESSLPCFGTSESVEHLIVQKTHLNEFN